MTLLQINNYDSLGVNMKKTALSLAVLGAFAANNAVAAPDASANVSGFADIIYTLVDEASDVMGGKNTTEGKFGANAEIDFAATVGAVTGRIDVDFKLTDPNGNSDSGTIEQAFFAWALADNMTLIGGVFNSPVGYEAVDAPDLDFTSFGLASTVLDGETIRDGNNITGVAGIYNFGMGSVTVAALNDLYDTDEENSFAVVLNLSPIEGLDLELGHVTQAKQADRPTSAEGVTDFNVQYAISGFNVGLEYLTAGKVVDAAYDLWGGYSFNDFAVKARYSTIEYEAAGTPDRDAITLYGSWRANDNLLIALEWRNDDDGSNLPAGDNDTITAEFIVTL